MVSRIEIKICGITNVEDAVKAYSYGADAVGFVFYEKSPRYVTQEAASRIIEKLPAALSKVGVFVNHSLHAVEDIRQFCGLDFIQLHGDESPDYCRKISKSILIKAISAKGNYDISALKNYKVKAFIVDSRHGRRYGGTGKQSNWDFAAKLREIHPVILSGGLNADNILDAIDRVSPDAVDVNSGIELSPGKKDPKKMQRIIEIVHNVERRSLETIFTRR